MPHKLQDYHNRIEAMMAQGDALVAARDPATLAEVKRRAGESALVIASYQLFIHREVFRPLLERADPAARARINEVKVECIALTEDLRCNARDFLAKEGALDWEVAAARVAWFNGRVREHIAAVRALMEHPADSAIIRRSGSVGVAA